MKKIVTIFITIITYNFAAAQDIIYTKNEGEIEAKIIDITRRFIRFKKHENLTGPNYTIANRHVDSIVYENGTKDIFSRRGSKLSQKKIDEIEKYKNTGDNLVTAGMGLSAHTFPNIIFGSNDDDYTPIVASHILYERLFLKQRLGVAISPFIGWNRYSYGATAIAKFYPRNTGKIRVAIGPSFTYNVQKMQHIMNIKGAGDFSNMRGARYTGRTAISSVAFNFSILSHITPKIFVLNDFHVGAISGIKILDNNLPANWKVSYNKTGDVILGAKIGVGYRF